MTGQIAELVTFKLAPDVDHETFVASARAANDWIEAQPGFVQRRLSVGSDSVWIEHIVWRSMEDAKAAAAKIGEAEEMRAFMTAIDGPSAVMRHNELKVVLG